MGIFLFYLYGINRWYFFPILLLCFLLYSLYKSWWLGDWIVANWPWIYLFKDGWWCGWLSSKLGKNEVILWPYWASLMQKCNNMRNLLNITCKLPNSSHRYQVAKQQNIADMCRLSVTNTLPVYAKRTFTFSVIQHCQTAVWQIQRGSLQTMG